MNIADIKKLEAGATIPSVTGVVSEVRDRRQVNGRKGLTSVQEITLKQGNDWISVAMWGRDDLSNLKGQEIKVTNDRGIPVKEESYNRKSDNKLITVKKLQVGEFATITSPGWGTPEAAPPPSHPAPTAASAVQQTHLRPTPDESGVKERLNRMANLYLDCIVATDYIWKSAPHNLSDEHYQACVASLFITATREGLHDKMATGKFNAPKQAAPKPQPPPPPPPPQREEPEVPNGGMAFDPNEDDGSDVPF